MEIAVKFAETLNGSEKQVAWAISIRAAAKTAIEGALNGKPLDARAQAALDLLFAQNEASYWIDRRDYHAVLSVKNNWFAEAQKLAMEGGVK